MKYVSYDNLKRTGSIIITLEGGIIQEIYKPVFLSEWNGDIIVLDYNTTDEDDEAYTEITFEDGEVSHCYYSVW